MWMSKYGDRPRQGAGSGETRSATCGFEYTRQ